MGFFSALFIAYGWMTIIGTFFGFACVVFLLLWKLNWALYDCMLKLPMLVFNIIIAPIVFLACFIWQLVRHPINIYYLFRAIALYSMCPFLFIYYLLKALFWDPFAKVWAFFKNRSAAQALSQFPKPHSANPEPHADKD